MKKDVKNQIVSLNENLFNEMFLQKLESRLETDPLLPNGLLNLLDDGDISPLCTCYENSSYIECTCYDGSTYIG